MFDIVVRLCYNVLMIDERRLKILTEGAKFDVSCSSSGSKRKNDGGIGNGYAAGCCHSFTPDGRCISLLKILMSNDCLFNCKYCQNRSDQDIPRATATPEEICELTMAFYKRNYIEGLFLSSAIHESPNKTMEDLVRTVKLLRTEHKFFGYIHVKGIPHADERLIQEAAKYADRMSFNIELPSERSLKLLAPQKSKESLLLPMQKLAKDKLEFTQERLPTRGFQKKQPLFLPAGQTTQMIVGASPESDGQIIRLSQGLYRKMGLKRVYYSSYVPIVHDSLLPDLPAGQLREHRLYQADWLLRYYGFTAEEIASEEENLSLELDPKCGWALKNLHLFPVEVNRAPLEILLRVPGIGVRGAQKIISARRYTKLEFEHLKRLRVTLKRAKHFITANGKFYGTKNELALHGLLAAGEQNAEQLSLFPPKTEQSLISPRSLALSALTGEL